MKRQALAAIAAAALLAGIGCSGGSGGSGIPAAPSQPAPGGSATAPATFTMKIPVASSGSSEKRPAYVSAGTQSVSIAATGVTTETFNVAPLPNASCPLVSGSYVCTLNFDAPIGSSTLDVTTYDGTNATGNVLSKGVVPITIVEGTTNAVSVTLNGVARTIGLLVQPSQILNGGTPASYTANLTALDSQGDYIVGTSVLNASFAALNPTLVSSSPTHLSVGSRTPSADGKHAAVVAVTGTAWTLTYDGADLSSAPPSITLSAAGYADVVATFAANPVPTPTPTPTPTQSPSPTPSMAANPTPAASGYVEFTSSGAKTLTITEAGYNGTYTVTSSNATVLSIDASPISSSAGTATLNVHANASGTANLTITDGNGQVLVVPTRVTISTVTINETKGPGL